MEGQILNKSDVDLKKVGLIFLAIFIVAGAFFLFRSFMSDKPERVVTWSTEGTYCFAVDAPYDGDTFRSGVYHFYNDNTIEGKPSRGWEIYVTKTYYKSIKDLKNSESSVCVIGSTETPTEFTAHISSGRYVYIIFRGTKGAGWHGTLAADILPELN